MYSCFYRIYSLIRQGDKQFKSKHKLCNGAINLLELLHKTQIRCNTASQFYKCISCVGILFIIQTSSFDRGLPGCRNILVGHLGFPNI